MNHEHIKQVAAVFDAAPRLTEIEVRSAGVALRLRRAAPGTSPAQNGLRPSAASAPALSNGVSVAANSVSPSAAAAGGIETTETTAAEGNTLVTAHMVGIFRATARSGRANGAEAAASVGEIVTEGQSLGSVETMRILNDCAAPASGVLHAVYVSEGQPVEYGQALFEIIPSPDAPADTES